MTPFWSDDFLTLWGGDCREVLRELPDESVHCVVTSPPYWALRDYGVAGQLGLEPTPEEFVANMVAVFREVKRVLRKDGTLWLNIGDSYNAYNGGAGPSSALSQTASEQRPRLESGYGLRTKGLKPKDLVGIPWRLAFALQADGWYLRSDIIWSKPNPMPESVTDRPTKAHEYVFLLSKSARYFFDAEAVREPTEWSAKMPDGWDTGEGAHGTIHRNGREKGANNGASGSGRNLRSVWTIATEPYPGAHFATFPRKLVEPCVKAGTSEKGVCPECGAPWVRVVEHGELVKSSHGGSQIDRLDQSGFPGRDAGRPGTHVRAQVTNGWRPSCRHYHHADGPRAKHGWPLDPVPAVVLDPFAGSGTTLLVAQSLGRRGVGIDLNPEYLRQALDRNRQAPLGLPA